MKPSLLTSPIGDDRLNLALRRFALEQAQSELLAELAREAPEGVRLRPGALPGDPAGLRGVPVVGGRGSMGGATRGSIPHIDGVHRADPRR